MRKTMVYLEDDQFILLKKAISASKASKRDTKRQGLVLSNENEDGGMSQPR
jgi:hypothetical protein